MSIRPLYVWLKEIDKSYHRIIALQQKRAAEVRKG
jgi:hypothetical protein